MQMLDSRCVCCIGLHAEGQTVDLVFTVLAFNIQYETVPKKVVHKRDKHGSYLPILVTYNLCIDIYE